MAQQTVRLAGENADIGRREHALIFSPFQIAEIRWSYLLFRFVTSGISLVTVRFRVEEPVDHFLLYIGAIKTAILQLLVRRARVRCFSV